MLKRHLKHIVIIASLGLATTAALAQDEAAPVEPEKVAPTAEDHALAKRASDAAKLAENTPGQEAANFLLHEWPKHMLNLLASENEVPPENLENARGLVKHLLETMEKGPDWPRPPIVQVPRARQPIDPDGVISEGEWQDALAFFGMYKFGESGITDAPLTIWRVLWDSKNLYFAFECQDSHIVAPSVERDGPVYDNDSVEMFILPDFDLGQYWELVISPRGSVFDALHTKKLKGWGPKPGVGGAAENISGLEFGLRVEETPNPGYIIEVVVPFAALPTYGQDRAPKPGDKLHFMMVRIDKNGETMTPYAFQPLLSWGHNIWNYAVMVLQEPAAE